MKFKEIIDGLDNISIGVIKLLTLPALFFGVVFGIFYLGDGVSSLFESDIGKGVKEILIGLGVIMASRVWYLVFPYYLKKEGKGDE